ncbi:MAG: CopG family antitoxin [Candidatus Poribacteria bacterium]|nr:CopG family antitoxin [Candidatus Poribacteria bacterium]
MSNENVREVPDEMTLAEAAEFWDEHSFLDYEDIEEVHFSVDLRRNKNYVDIDANLAKHVRMIARQQGVSARQLVNQWLQERIVRDIKQAGGPKA